MKAVTQGVASALEGSAAGLPRAARAAARLPGRLPPGFAAAAATAAAAAGAARRGRPRTLQPRGRSLQRAGQAGVRLHAKHLMSDRYH